MAEKLDIVFIRSRRDWPAFTVHDYEGNETGTLEPEHVLEIICWDMLRPTGEAPTRAETAFLRD
jgi:hypothetical protein